MAEDKDPRLTLTAQEIDAAAHAAHLCALEGWSLDAGGLYDDVVNPEELRDRLEEVLKRLQDGMTELRGGPA